MLNINCIKGINIIGSCVKEEEKQNKQVENFKKI